MQTHSGLCIEQKQGCMLVIWQLYCSAKHKFWL